MNEFVKEFSNFSSCQYQVSPRLTGEGADLRINLLTRNTRA